MSNDTHQPAILDSAASVRDSYRYDLPVYPFVAPPELCGATPIRYAVTIVGAGLAGLTLACDLAHRGIACVLLDEDNTVGVRGASSRGIVYAQKSLEIFARLGIYARIADKGITWSVGRTLAGDAEVYHFDMQRANDSVQPPFINLQQFYVETFLVERIQELGVCDLRWQSRVTKVQQNDTGVSVQVSTPQGDYWLEADWLIDASGVNSVIRESLGLDPHPARSADRWCITDVRVTQPWPLERWTWVEAPFNDNRAVWQHPMGDGVWRLDYQMAPDADPDYVSRPDVVEARLRAHLGPDCAYEQVWVGPYSYRDHLLPQFRHQHVFFIGDAAHLVCPFGARGGNAGIQDADNLGWKLALVRKGQASTSLLDSYHDERHAAAVQNLEVTSRTARFLAPRSPAEFTLRKAVLQLAHEFAFARPLVNTGRMSIANAYPESPTVTNHGDSMHNTPLVFAPGAQSNLVALVQQVGTAYIGLLFGTACNAEFRALEASAPVRLFSCAAKEYDPHMEINGGLGVSLCAKPGDFALIRPDLYVSGIIHNATAEQARSLLERALGHAHAVGRAGVPG